MRSTGLSVVASGAWGTTSSAPPVWVVGDDADPPSPRAEDPVEAEEGPFDPDAPELSDPANPAIRTVVTYRPSVLLAARVRSRDGACTSPVCHRPARAGGTQLDHSLAWGPATPTRLRGGLTEAGDLGCACQRWHTAKTHGDWTLHQPTPGPSTWTSPTDLLHRA